MRQVILGAAICSALGHLTMATAQVVTPQEEHEFRASVDRLLDEKKVRSETQQMAGAYRRATHVVEAALREHFDANPRAPLALIEAARMLRAVECSPLLADNIDLQSPSSFETGPFSSFPAARALAEFGSVALPATFARLGGEKSERQLLLFALVVLRVDGKRLAIARLEQLVEEHVTGNDYQGELQPYIKNLRRVLEIVRTVDLSRQENWLARVK